MAATSRGIDVSSYQGAQDWKALARGGITFAQAKASEGQHTRDARYRTHMDGILAAPSLLPGAYHYGWPTQDPHTEADNYIGAVQHDADAHPAFVHWLDLERRSDGANYAGRTSNQIRAWAEAWIDRVKGAFPRQRVGCYTSGDDIKTGRYPGNSDALWYPAYPAGAMSYTQAEQRTRPAPSGVKALFWQFTSTPLDRSIAYMTPAALRAWAGQEDDMPLTPADIKAVAAEVVKQLAPQLAVQPWTYRNATADTASVKAGHRIPDAYGYLVQTATSVQASTAAVQTLASLAGKNVDTATVVAALREAIAEAVVHVDVDVTGAK